MAIRTNRVYNYGNVPQTNFPNIQRNKMFSPLGFARNQSQNLSAKNMKRHRSHIKFGSTPRSKNIPSKSRNMLKWGHTTSRGSQVKHLFPMTLEEAKRGRNRDSKFTDTLLSSMSSPLAPKATSTAMNFWKKMITKPNISDIESQIQEDKQKVDRQRELMKNIKDLEKKHNTKVPYKLFHTLDMPTIHGYFKKVERKKELRKIIITIQACVRGWLQKKRYKKHLQNKIRLAVKVQRSWKRYYRRIKAKKQKRVEYLAKIVRIQSFFRGFLTRKKWDEMMKDRLISNQQYFEIMRDRVKDDAAMVIQRVWKSIVERIRKMKKVISLLHRRKKRVIIAKWRKYMKKIKKSKIQKNLYGNSYNSSNQEPRKSSAVDNFAISKLLKRKRKAKDVSDNKFLKVANTKTKAMAMLKNRSSPNEQLSKAKAPVPEKEEFLSTRMKSENHVIVETKSDSDSSQEGEESEDEKNHSDDDMLSKSKSSQRNKEDVEELQQFKVEEPEIVVLKADDNSPQEKKAKSVAKSTIKPPELGHKKTQKSEASSFMQTEETANLKNCFSQLPKKLSKMKSKAKIKGKMKNN
ncbi:unnamed protein product [Moneuplotes crassus]|uniref:Uncharacterized protein n=1 Tax=Euplotes crassus TaxID=5936 RepID=A0AAD1Y3R7_EUPCR|nr:unnamed protein product [Moneuplotes crassus]